jgi:hypothetical protein
MDNLTFKIGKITEAFVRIDFIVSNIAYLIKYKDSEYHFFADTHTGAKINSLIKYLTDNKQVKFSNEICNCLKELDQLRIDRNKIVHSLILTNAQDDTEFMRHHFMIKDNELYRDFCTFKITDLDNLHDRFVGLNNKLILIIDKINGG